YGYVLHASAEELDVLRFETLSAAGRRALRDGDERAALASLAAALALWRGPFLSDMTATRFLAAEAARLAERRLSAYEEWAELCVRIGDAHEVLDTIDELTEAHPHHERLN